MTSPPSPPNRRRRRIVATIAVMVLGLGWWLSRPKIDPRLVGMWSFGTNESDLASHTSSYILKPDGTGRYLFSGNEQFPIRWQFQSDTLTLTRDIWVQTAKQPWLTRWYNRFAIWKGRISSGSTGFTSRFRIESIELGEIHLVGLRGQQRYRLTRSNK
jgi:hypothetical protein